MAKFNHRGFNYEITLINNCESLQATCEDINETSFSDSFSEVVQLMQYSIDTMLETVPNTLYELREEIINLVEKAPPGWNVRPNISPLAFEVLIKNYLRKIYNLDLKTGEKCND